MLEVLKMFLIVFCVFFGGVGKCWGVLGGVGGCWGVLGGVGGCWGVLGGVGGCWGVLGGVGGCWGVLGGVGGCCVTKLELLLGEVGRVLLKGVVGSVGGV